MVAGALREVNGTGGQAGMGGGQFLQALGLSSPLRVNEIIEDEGGRIARRADQVSDGRQGLHVENLRTGWDKNQIGQPRGVNGRAFVFPCRVNDSEVCAVRAGFVERLPQAAGLNG